MQRVLNPADGLGIGSKSETSDLGVGVAPSWSIADNQHADCMTLSHAGERAQKKV
jgi:hypothetical protein